MFIQVLQGRAADEAGIRRCMDQWRAELMPGATGYLGTTAGFTDDGTFIALARFDSAAAAMANGERPEQSAWWAQMEKCFDGTVQFLNCADVQQWLGGGSDEAGFVQIMEGVSPDVHRMHELMETHAERIRQTRPEIMGGLFADAGDGRYVEAVYFTSEVEARRAETMDMPEDLRDALAEETELMGDVAYFDLHEPVLVSAR